MSEIKEKLEKLKEEYLNGVDLETIEKEIDGIDDKIAHKRFNPDTISLSTLHDIMDDIQEIRSNLGKLMKKLLRQKLHIAAYLYKVSAIYNIKYEELFVSNSSSKEEKVLKQTVEFKTRKQLRDEEIEKYKNLGEFKELKVKGHLEELNAHIKTIEELDETCSRKITLMQLQRELGTLVDVKGKK